MTWKTKSNSFLLRYVLFCLIAVHSKDLFISAFAPSNHQHDKCVTVLRNDKFRRDLEESSRENAKVGPGETVAGAVLGGLLLGPFGALFGAQLGASMGANMAVDRARKEEMKKLGINEGMLQMAQDVGIALEKSSEGLRATIESLRTQQSYARRLDEEATDLYEKAKEAMAENDEELARDLLFKRKLSQEKLVTVLKQCAEAKNRVAAMEQNVASLEVRSKEVEALLYRAAGAKSTADIPMDFSLKNEDPLLQKFKDLGID